MQELGDRPAIRMASLIWRYPGGLRTPILHNLLDKFGLLGFKI